jgi:hypothetical protein
VPFSGFEDFEALTSRALAMASAQGSEPDVYAHLLRLLADCYPAHEGLLYDQQCRGASYRSLAAIGHRVGMTKQERGHWYRISEEIPLTQRHAGHILSRLARRAA